MESSTMNTVAVQENPRQSLYFNLIDELLKCLSGQEPEILDSHSDLLDEGFVRSLVQVATYFAHENNFEAAQFLIHVARELAKQLGLYPETPTTPISENTYNHR